MRLVLSRRVRKMGQNHASNWVTRYGTSDDNQQGQAPQASLTFAATSSFRLSGWATVTTLLMSQQSMRPGFVCCGVFASFLFLSTTSSAACERGQDLRGCSGLRRCCGVFVRSRAPSHMVLVETKTGETTNMISPIRQSRKLET